LSLLQKHCTFFLQKPKAFPSRDGYMLLVKEKREGRKKNKKQKQRERERHAHATQLQSLMVNAVNQASLLLYVHLGLLMYRRKF